MHPSPAKYNPSHLDVSRGAYLPPRPLKHAEGPLTCHLFAPLPYKTFLCIFIIISPATKIRGRGWDVRERVLQLVFGQIALQLIKSSWKSGTVLILMETG